MTNQNLYIVTGSSKGIGKALVHFFLKSDQNMVIGISRSQEQIHSDNYFPLTLDLSKSVEIEKISDQIFPQGNFSRIVLINNAGWIGEIDHLGKLSPESIQSIFDINTVAPAILMNEFVKRYGKNSDIEKMVVNISSGAAKKAIDGWSGYCASKAALNMLSLTAQEEADITGSGIRYFAVSPGVVDTAMQEDIRSASIEKFSSLQKFQELKANEALSSPEDTARKILHLIENPEAFKEVLQDVRDLDVE